jgi:hypothetical protein
MRNHLPLTRRGVKRRSLALAIVAAVSAVIGALVIATTASSATTAGPPDQVSLPEQAKVPEQPGRPDGAGAPGTTGRPDQDGRPDAGGKPDTAGRPDRDGDEHHPVTICHATGSRSNPYVKITVDDDAIVHEGHGSHEGPIFSPSLPKGADWGDVIPPFDFGPDAKFAGLNHNAQGKALLETGCDMPGDEPGKPDNPGTKPDGHGAKPDNPGSKKPGATEKGATTTTVAVKGATAESPSTSTPSGGLPITGARSTVLAGIALLLVAAGAGVMILRRRQGA